MSLKIEIASHHDAQAYAALYNAQGRVQIREFLTAASASALEACLKTEVAYNTLFNKGDKVFFVTDQQMASLSPQERTRVVSMAESQATEGFQYFYDAHRVSDQGEAYVQPREALRAYSEFIRGPAFLDFMRTVTGTSAIDFADAQATRYRRGSFLNHHTDDVVRTNRLAAYVLNLTQKWRPDWGGVLLFVDDDGNVSEGFTPTFNAMNLFRVPQGHMVSQVASYAGADRLSITGWLRSKPAA